MIKQTLTPWLVTKDCHFCGMNQTSDTAFSGLFKLSAEALQALEDSGNKVNDISAYFEITVCDDCLRDLFNGSIDTAITECSKTTNKAFTG